MNTTEKEIEILSLFLTNGDNKKIQPNYLDNPFMSWDILMEVVEKIESLGFDFAIYTGSVVSIINTKDFPFDEIINLVASSKIEAVYNACVEFIKWYNEQKKE